jgi:hypothetical protein
MLCWFESSQSHHPFALHLQCCEVLMLALCHFLCRFGALSFLSPLHFFLSASEAIFLMGQELLHFAVLREFLFYLCYAFFKHFSRILQLSHQGFFRFNAKISPTV